MVREYGGDPSENPGSDEIWIGSMVAAGSGVHSHAAGRDREHVWICHQIVYLRSSTHPSGETTGHEDLSRSRRGGDGLVGIWRPAHPGTWDDPEDEET